jgi:hypothetical protein
LKDVNGAEKHTPTLYVCDADVQVKDIKKIRANSSVARVHFISLASTGPS